MAEGALGSIHIPWYATGFRADGLEAALARDRAGGDALRGAAPTGSTARATTATSSSRSRASPTRRSWERYWYGPEFTDWRAQHSSWYQVPVLYEWDDVASRARWLPEPAPAS